MKKEDVIYRLLQRHLDKQAVGFPAVKSGADIRLLKRLFTPDEAALALHLSYKPSPLDEIVQKASPGRTADQTKSLLDSMLMKGAIGWKKKNGVNHWFVMPMVIGMYEAQDGVPSRAFLLDAMAYMRTPAFGTSMLAARPSQMRTIPIDKTISAEHGTATYEQIRAVIRDAPLPIVAVQCICREAMVMRKRPCKQTQRLETCLGFGDMAASALRRGHGREISREEALNILALNEKDGLVLQPANAQKPEFVCSCCGCCCGMLNMLKRLPRPLDFWTCGFYASVNADLCTRCGRCVTRCQAGAVALKGPGGRAKISLNRCIGCGLCVTTCPASAISLRKRKTGTTMPPEEEEALNDAIMANKKGAAGKWGMLLKAALGIKP